MKINLDVSYIETILQVYALANIGETIISHGQDKKDSNLYSVHITPSDKQYTIGVRLAESEDEKEIEELYQGYIAEADRYNESIKDKKSVQIYFDQGDKDLNFILMFMTKLIDSMPGSRQVLLKAIIDVVLLLNEQNEFNRNQTGRQKEVSSELPNEKQNDE